jgi:hypothetical protein
MDKIAGALNDPNLIAGIGDGYSNCITPIGLNLKG